MSIIRKAAFIITLSLIVALTACGSQRTEVERIDVDWPLYEVSDNSGNKMYVLGTIHLGKAGMYPFPDSLNEALLNSKYLVTEVDMRELSTQETA
ncbi:MAG: TraB/GumN family protein, partial [Bacilli bacterium]